jgi:hypothetical protein
MKNQSPRSRPRAGGSNAADKAARELRERFPDANEFARKILQPPCPLEALNRLGRRLADAKVTKFGKQRGRRAVIVFSEEEINLYGLALARVVLLGKAPT